MAFFGVFFFSNVDFFGVFFSEQNLYPIRLHETSRNNSQNVRIIRTKSKETNKFDRFLYAIVVVFVVLDIERERKK